MVAKDLTMVLAAEEEAALAEVDAVGDEATEKAVGEDGAGKAGKAAEAARVEGMKGVKGLETWTKTTTRILAHPKTEKMVGSAEIGQMVCIYFISSGKLI